MIIRFTVHDNDYTNTIKSFYKHIKFDNSLWTHKENFSKEDKEQLIEFEELLKKGLYNKDEMTVKEWRRLELFLDWKFNHFLKQISKEHLIHQKSIDIVSMVADVNHNGEYIYYFVETDQIVVL